MSQIPQIYLVEPYNAYAPNPKGGRKKHWTEIVEEQALLERIIAEAAKNNSSTLPPNSPNIAQSGPNVVGQGQGQTGGGGAPFVAYFNPRMTAGIFVAAVTSSAPVSYLFSNVSNPDLLAQGVANFLWNFGDGTTSTEINPTHAYATTGSFQVTLRATAVSTGITASATQSLLISAPTVNTNFAISSSISGSTRTLTGSAPLIVDFANLTTTNNAANSITYNWNFGTGSLTSSLVTPPDLTYTATGSYTVRLTATGSFGIASSASALILVTT